jgi:PHD/YefM family antitoxin component YafN of YafNO toxin-antitoxin module
MSIKAAYLIAYKEYERLMQLQETVHALQEENQELKQKVSESSERSDTLEHKNKSNDSETDLKGGQLIPESQVNSADMIKPTTFFEEGETTALNSNSSEASKSSNDKIIQDSENESIEWWYIGEVGEWLEK